jgi:triacylglycerol lipase
LTGREIAFKPATFYLGIADHLARVVEGQESEEPAESSGEGRDRSDAPPMEGETEISREPDGQSRERTESPLTRELKTTGEPAKLDDAGVDKGKTS